MGNGVSRTPKDEFACAVVAHDYLRMKEYYLNNSSVSSKQCNSYAALSVEASSVEDFVALFDACSDIIGKAMYEYDEELQDCRNPAVIIEKYSRMSVEKKNTFHINVLNSIIKDDKSKALKAKKTQDYSLSFAGTAADTNAEREAAEISESHK